MKYITYSISILLLIGLSIISCKQEPRGVQPEPDTNTQKEVVKPQETKISYPMIDQATMTEIASKCTQVDYIFYNLPISLNQSKPEAIRKNIMFIGGAGVSGIPAGCRPMGRKFFAGDGETIIEADMYLNPELGCAFYIFHVDGKPKFANMMTQEAVNFYMNVFQQAGVKLNGGK